MGEVAGARIISIFILIIIKPLLPTGSDTNNLPFDGVTGPYEENLQTERAQRKWAGWRDAATEADWFHHRQTSLQSQTVPWHTPQDPPTGPPAQGSAACAVRQRSDTVFQKSYH